MADDIVWRGIVEKRGNDIIRRWLIREVVFKTHECNYFDPTSGELRGNIPLDSTSEIEVDNDTIEVKTIGRAEKSKYSLNMFYMCDT
jgi:hypothetical protein